MKIKQKNFKKKRYTDNDEINKKNEEENEYDPIKGIQYSKLERRKKDKLKKYLNITIIILLFILIICICIYARLKFLIKNIKVNKDKNNIITDSSEINKKVDNLTYIIRNSNISNENSGLNNNKDEKIGVAFVYKAVFGNGIGRMLSLICSALSHIEKYDIYLITGKGFSLDFKFDERVKKVRIAGNKTEIEKFDKTSNIKIYVLHNDLTPSSIQWYKSLNGGKIVIGQMHGVYLSSIFSNQTGVYSIWKYNNLYDASVHVIADDYYVNKRLGINNTFFIPNMYTFEPGITPNSNLTYKNLMIMGRELDRIKGGLYGIKAMDLIRKEIPDAKLYFISSNYKIDFLENLIDELDLRRNIEVLHYTENISHYFLNSSILLCPSLSEASPLVMNEGKAHGLPIVAFNVSYSPPYQKGVIVVDIMNYTKLAEECIKLLKDYNYRKIKGLEAKLSMNEFSNKDIVERWDRLFMALINNDTKEYYRLQNYTYERYYNEETARDHLESNWKMGQKFNKYFCCHDFKDMLNYTYIDKIKGCVNQDLCK